MTDHHPASLSTERWDRSSILSPKHRRIVMDVSKLKTTKVCADILGVALCRVTQLSNSRGVKPLMVAGRRFWTDAQITAMRPKKSGRPRKALPVTAARKSNAK